MTNKNDGGTAALTESKGVVYSGGKIVTQTDNSRENSNYRRGQDIS